MKKALILLILALPTCTLICPEKTTALDRDYIASVQRSRTLLRAYMAVDEELNKPENAQTLQDWKDLLIAQEFREKTILALEELEK